MDNAGADFAEADLAGADFSTIQNGEILATVLAPIPWTRFRSSTLANGPLVSRFVIMRSASTGPTFGNKESSLDWH